MLKREALQLLGEKIAGCEKCQELVFYRKGNKHKTVPGEGNSNSRLMFIGEAPGQDEAKSGRPFVGAAGKLLDNIIKAAGWCREQVFIANILKCRPPGNRVPEIEEAANCRKFLDMQIKLVDPEWLVCLGKTASVYLLGLGDPANDALADLRGVRDWQGRKVICTYHPSFLLRPENERFKICLWDDIQPAISTLQNQKTS